MEGSSAIAFDIGNMSERTALLMNCAETQSHCHSWAFMVSPRKISPPVRPSANTAGTLSGSGAVPVWRLSCECQLEMGKETIYSIAR
jgi:hypothetical protein